MSRKVADKADVNELAKTFAVEWADACKYQVSLRYHHMGDGPNAQKVRWAFESAIKYIVVCATKLADHDDDVEFKKEVSDYVRDVIIQSLIDSLQNVKVRELSTFFDKRFFFPALHHSTRLNFSYVFSSPLRSSPVPVFPSNAQRPEP